MQFRYLRDPLFLACVAVYGLNRFWLRGLFPQSFCTSYLNDLLCIGFWVPPLVWGLHKLRLRVTEGPPTGAEVVIPLLIWAVVFELLLPRLPFFERRVTADYRDIFFYALGGLLASCCWRLWYRTRRDPAPAPPPPPAPEEKPTSKG